MTTFEFYRFRFYFRAIDAVHFRPGKSGNAIRGALGAVLHDTASPEAYARLFAPRAVPGEGPSGLADWPRPFILRSAHLDGMTLAAGGSFYFDVHVFDLRAEALGYFRAAFAQLADTGLGPRRGRVSLERIEQLDLQGRAAAVTNSPGAPSAIGLDPDLAPVAALRVQFLTPTELKSEGVVVKQPEFPVLFARLRDRIATLRALYGAGPLDIDYRALGERAAAVRLSRCELMWEGALRRSGRTGQVHPLGGFTGYAEYEGELAEFLPWLRAARWVGVGRQTVWGKGDVRVIPSDTGGL